MGCDSVLRAICDKAGNEVTKRDPIGGVGVSDPSYTVIDHANEKSGKLKNSGTKRLWVWMTRDMPLQSGPLDGEQFVHRQRRVSKTVKTTEKEARESPLASGASVWTG